MFLHAVILGGSIYAILKASDLFVDLASSLGRRWCLKEYFIGSFIVGIGTSLPELFTSIAAIGENQSGIVVPTIYGTVAANIGAGLGLAVLTLYFWVPVDGRRRLFTWKHAQAGGALDFRAEGPGNSLTMPLLFVAVSVILSWAIFRDGTFDWRDAGLFLICYAVFMVFEFIRKNKPTTSRPIAPVSVAATRPSNRTRDQTWWQYIRVLGPHLVVLLLFAVCLFGSFGGELLSKPHSIVLFLVGLAVMVGVQFKLLRTWRGRDSKTDFDSFPSIVLRRRPQWKLAVLLAITMIVVYFSGVVVVKAIMQLADDFGLGTGVLAASALAFGTSIPDIAVAVTVARRGRHRMLAGHIMQSNLFDVFLIMAICGFITPLSGVSEGPAYIAIRAALVLTLPLLLIIHFRRINFWGGLGLFGGYVFFLFLIY